MAVLTALATVGVFSLFALAAGIFRTASRDNGHSLFKAAADGAADSIVITDAGGRVVYALEDLKAWADRGFVTSTSDPRGNVLPAKRHAAVTPAFGGGQAR